MYVIKLLQELAYNDFLPMTFPHFALRMGKEEFVALGAKFQKQPIGLVLAKRDELAKSATLCSLFVEPRYRMMGVGTALLLALHRELVKRKCCQIVASYLTNNFEHLFFEKILNKCGWQKGTAKNLFLEFDGSNYPLFKNLPPLSCEYKLFLFSELNAHDLDVIRRGKATLYPPALDPFNGEKKFEPLNSVGLRYGSEIAGWMVTHRIFPDTIRYSTLWVRNDLQRRHAGLHLINQAIRLQSDSPVHKATVFLALQYPAMLRLAEKRLVPHCISSYESKKAVKIL